MQSRMLTKATKERLLAALFNAKYAKVTSDHLLGIINTSTLISVTKQIVLEISKYKIPHELITNPDLVYKLSWAFPVASSAEWQRAIDENTAYIRTARATGKSLMQSFIVDLAKEQANKSSKNKAVADTLLINDDIAELESKLYAKVKANK